MCIVENYFVIIVIIIIIIIKTGRQCKAGKERSTLFQSKDSSPTVPTIDRKKRKGKIVKDKKG